MMPITVTCSNELNQKLAQIWLDAADRNAVSLASNALDQVLKENPLAGTDRGGVFFFTAAPLTVAYTFSPDDCNVTILDYCLDE